MNTWWTLLATTAFSAALLACPWPARADNDHDRARAALQAGEILPLPKVLESVSKDHPGHVLEVELDRENGRWVYELKILQSNGQIVKLELDARNGQVLKRKNGKH